MTKCELCDERAVMLIYARNPGTPVTPSSIARGDNPFYPPEEADYSANFCVSCFHDMAATMREEGYVQIRATATRLNKPA